MATHKGIARVIYLLRRAYPDHVKRHLSESGALVELGALYERFLSDLPDALVERVAAEHIAKSQWWPKINELRQPALDLLDRENGVVSAIEAWAHVNLWRRRPGYVVLTDLEMKALSVLPNKAYSMQDSYMADRARFCQAYETYQARHRQETYMLPEVKELAESMRMDKAKQLEGG